MPSAVPNSGEVEASVLDSVGPRCRTPATERLALNAGRNTPISAKIRIPSQASSSGCSRNGASSQRQAVDVTTDTSAPLREGSSPRREQALCREQVCQYG